MKKVVLVSLVSMSLLFSACIPTQTAPRSVDSTTTGEKQGVTTKKGTISEVNGQYYLNEAGQPVLPIDSYSVDLSTYVDKLVTVSGQYSGDTLFVDEVI